MVFLHARRGNRVDARGRGESPVLRHQGRRRVLRDHEAGVDAWLRGEKRRQSLGAVRIKQAIDPAFGDSANLRGGDGQEIRRKRKGLAVEVARRLDVAVLHHDRVVDCGSELHSRHAPGEVQRVARRARDLRAAADGVGILHRMMRVAMRGDDARSAQHQHQIRCARDLSWMRTDLMEARLERPVGPEQGLG